MRSSNETMETVRSSKIKIKQWDHKKKVWWCT